MRNQGPWSRSESGMRIARCTWHAQPKVSRLVLATILRLGSGETLSAAALGQNLVLTACLMFFSHLVWRAMNAAQALRRLQLVEHFS